MFIMNVIAGDNKPKYLFALILTNVKSLLASLNLIDSFCCLSKARITLTPVKFSLNTSVVRSIFFCMDLIKGKALNKITKIKMINKGAEIHKIQIVVGSNCTVIIIMAIIKVNGAWMMILKPIKMAC